MKTVGRLSFLLFTLALVYVAEGLRRSYGRTGSPTLATQRPHGWKPSHGGSHHQVTAYPTDDPNTVRPDHRGGHHQYTPGPTDGSNTARPVHGGGQYHGTTPHPRHGDTNTRGPAHGGDRHHATGRPPHRYPSYADNATPVPTNSFQMQFQRYLRKLAQRKLVEDAPAKKSHDIETPTDHVQCPSHRVPCRNTGVCIDTAWFCDGENDCIDWSDEEHCPRD